MSNLTSENKALLEMILELSQITSPDELLKEGLNAFNNKLGFEHLVLHKLSDNRWSIDSKPISFVLEDEFLDFVKTKINTLTTTTEKCENFVLAQSNLYANGILLFKNVWLIFIKERQLLEEREKIDLSLTLQIFHTLLKRITNQVLGPTAITKNSVLEKFNKNKVFQHITDVSEESILISDTNGTLCYANDTSKKWLGIDNKNYEDIKVYDYEKFFKNDKIKKWQQHVIELKSIKKQTTFGKLKNYNTGEIIKTKVNLTYFENSGIGYVCAKSRDITEKINLRLNANKEEQLQEMLLKMASTYINTDLQKTKVLINKALKEIGEFVKADRAYIFNYDLFNKTTSNTYEWCSEGISPEIENLQNISTAFMPEWINAHKNKKPFTIEDVKKLPDTGSNGLRSILEQQGIKSLITLPMHNSNRLIGFVGFDSVKQTKKYTDREEKLLSVYAEILVNIDLRQKYERELVNQKERFNKIISSIDLGLIELNSNLDITFVNNSFLRFYSYTLENVIGKNILNFLVKDINKEKIVNKLSQIKIKETFSEELITLDSYGKEKIVFASFVKQTEVHGTLRYLGTLVDLSPQKELQQELQKSVLKTEQASKAKEIFLANMSHELRTPLNIINGSLTEINKQKISNETKLMLNYANSASTHMLNLVNNILDFSKITSGEIELEPSEFNLSNNVKEIFGIFKLLADEKNLSYKLNLDPNIVSYVTGDYGKLNQVLINLIGNAIKYTKKGKVTLNVKLLKEFKKKIKIRFTIEDTGVGMSPFFLNRIFEEYKRDILVNNLQGGTGLGMPISKRLINVLGGEIKIKSKLNQGTQVEFDIEFNKINSLPAEQVTNVNSELFNNINILVVEDNFMNAVIMERKLMSLGAKVIKAENGKIALDLMSKFNFNLVLMDIQMPVMNGLEATVLIREIYGPSIPIIAITANAFKHNIDKCLFSGMNDIITKPFKDEDLHDIILKWIGLKVIDSEKVVKKNKPFTLQTVKYSVDRIVEISNDDSDFVHEMIAIFIKIASKSIENLNQAIKEENKVNIKKIAHKLRASLDDLQFKDALKIVVFLDTERNISIDTMKNKAKELIQMLKICITELEKDFML